MHPNTFWPVGPKVHQINLLDCLCNVSDTYRVTHVIIGSRKRTIPVDASIDGWKLEISREGVLSSSSTTPINSTITIYYNLHTEQFFTAKVHIVHFASSMGDQHAGESVDGIGHVLLRTGKRPAIAACYYGESVCTSSTTAITAVSMAIDDEGVFVRWIAKPCVIAAIYEDCEPDIWFLMIHTTTPSVNVLVQPGKSRMLSWHELLKVPTSTHIQSNFDLFYQTSFGWALFDACGLYIESEHDCGTWTDGPIPVTPVPGVFLNVVIITGDSDPPAPIRRLVPFGKSINIQMPAYHVYRQHRTSSCVNVSHVAGFLTISSTTPGTYDIHVGYEFCGETHTFLIQVHMPEQLEPEIVSVAVGELCAPQDWRDAYVAGYSVGELDSNPSGIVRAGVPILPFVGIELDHANGFRAVVPGSLELAYPSGRRVIVSFVEKVSISRSIAIRRRDPINSPYIVIGVEYADGPLHDLPISQTFSAFDISSRTVGSQVYKKVTMKTGYASGTYISRGTVPIYFVPRIDECTAFSSAKISVILKEPTSSASVTQTAAGVPTDVVASITLEGSEMQLHITETPVTWQTCTILVYSNSTQSYADIDGGPPVKVECGAYGAYNVTLAPVPPTEISLGKIGQEIVLGAEVFTYPSSIAITPSITTHGPLSIRRNTNGDSRTISIILNVATAASTAAVVTTLSNTRSASWPDIDIQATTTITWACTTMPSLRISITQPSTRLQNVTALKLQDSDGTEIDTYSLQGDLLTLRSLISGTYHLWYIANDLLLYRTISLVNIANTITVEGIVGLPFHFELPGNITNTTIQTDGCVLTSIGSHASATISQTGTFSIILGGSLLVVLIGKPMVLAWTCNAMAFTDMPYAIPLPIAGDPHITVDSQFSYEMTGQVLYLQTDASRATITITTTSEDNRQVVIDATLHRVQTPLFTAKTHSGTIFLPTTLQLFRTVGIAQLSIDDQTLVEFSLGSIVNMSYPFTRSVPRNIGPGLYIGGESAMYRYPSINASIDGARLRRDVQSTWPDGDQSSIAISFDPVTNELHYVTYYDSEHSISLTSYSAGSTNFTTYNGRFAISAHVGNVRVPVGETLEFEIDGIVHSFGPPGYAPDAQYAVEIVPATEPDFVDFTNFNPSFMKIISPTHLNMTGTYDFESRIYAPNNSAGLDAFTLTYYVDRVTITHSGYLVSYGGTRVPDQTYASGSVQSVVCLTDETFLSVYVIMPEIQDLPLDESRVTNIDGNLVRIIAPATVHVDSTAATRSIVIAWTTSSHHGKIRSDA